MVTNVFRLKWAHSSWNFVRTSVSRRTRFWVWSTSRACAPSGVVYETSNKKALRIWPYDGFRKDVPTYNPLWKQILSTCLLFVFFFFLLVSETERLISVLYKKNIKMYSTYGNFSRYSTFLKACTAQLQNNFTLRLGIHEIIEYFW